MDKKTIEQLIESHNKAFKGKGLDFALADDNPYHKYFVLDKIREELFSLKDIVVSARVLNHWKNNNILPLSRPGRWNKFSLLELVWIDIVRALRSYGFPLQKISLVRDQLFQPIKIEEDTGWVDVNLFYEDVYRKYGRIYSFNILGGYLAYMLSQRKQVLLTVLSDGKCSINDSGTFLLYETAFITIPLFPLIKYFILDHNNRSKMMDLGIITKEEQMILDSVRSGDAKSLTIRFDKGREISLIEEGKDIDLKNVRERLGDVIGKGEYGQMVLIYKNGKIVSANKSDNVYHK